MPFDAPPNRLGVESFATKIGEVQMQRLINWILGYLATVTLPIK